MQGSYAIKTQYVSDVQCTFAGIQRKEAMLLRSSMCTFADEAMLLRRSILAVMNYINLMHVCTDITSLFSSNYLSINRRFIWICLRLAKIIIMLSNGATTTYSPCHL